uniref:PqiB family protein n=1 Tax=Thaumasiovibrio occultus TaxID=1891184 RepID=UPI000B354595|nr:MlaD family protein [Thaumasiovibrio occultus]
MTENSIPQATERKNARLSPLWILPLLSVILAGWLVYDAVSAAGTRISIQFENAQGLVPGRTPIRYKGLEVGMVRSVDLNTDLNGITVGADIYPNAASTLRQDTQFWLVSPQASLEGISGLDALVAGNYIALNPGTSSSASSEFIGLSSAPSDANYIDGLHLQLTSNSLNGISVGSKILFRRIPVGEVINYRLSEDTQDVLINIVVYPNYSHLVKGNSSFWNISGFKGEFGLDGVDINFEGLSSLILGGIAFDSPTNTGNASADVAKPNSTYTLYESLSDAGKGIEITLDLPTNSDLRAGSSPVLYKGVAIGELTAIDLNADTGALTGVADIDPVFSHLLTENSRFVIEEPKLSLQGVENLSNLVLGNFLTLLPADGEPSVHFTAQTQRQQFVSDENNPTVVLFSDDSFGMEAGVSVRHRGIEVGEIKSVTLVDNQVRTEIVIKQGYADLIKSDNRFYVDSGLQAEVSPEGVSVDVAPFKRLIRDTLSFTSAGKSHIADAYTLFPSKHAARLAASNQSGVVRYQLSHPQKAGIEIGSGVFYRGVRVGKVAAQSLSGDQVLFGLDIEKQYSHLIGEHTVFWNYSGLKVDAGLTGVNIEAGPLTTLVNGGIAFDQIQGIHNKDGRYFRLYDNEKQARQSGQRITLIANDARAISKTTPIRYQGITIGEVNETQANFARNNVRVEVTIYPEYVANVVRKDSYFWVVKPKISLTESENLESLLTTYIAVVPGKSTAPVTNFTLHDAPKEQQGVTFTLQSDVSHDISKGSPVLFRQIQVGEVRSVALGELADRVNIEINIYSPHRHLVRQNSLFWVESGVEFSVGLTGATVETRTLDSILKGGIAFATPSGPIQPRGKAGRTYLLHDHAEPAWQEWRAAIPK